MSTPQPTLAAAAATASASANKLRGLLKQQKQNSRPHPVGATASAASPAAKQVSGQKRTRDATDAAAPATPAKPSAAAAMASALEAHSKQSHQKKKQKVAAAAAAAARPTPAPSTLSSGSAAPVRKLSALQQKMAAKLAGARFRWLNEKLYTCTGSEAWEYFQSHPSEFDEYHRGFGVQVQDWPSNPLDGCIDFLKARSPKLVVGDFGCGEARLSASVPNKVHSFDLVAANERVTACNISNVPLKDGTLDVAIFCLSLMGVDFIAFIREAHRTLKQGGILLISEVRSRFEEAGLEVFLRAVCDVGFTLRRKDLSNNMFATMEFVKGGKAGQKQGGEEDDEEGEEEGERAHSNSHSQSAAQRKQGGGHNRNKAKGKAPVAGKDAKSGSKKKAGAGGQGFSHPVKKGSAPAGEGAPMLTACIYKKR